MKRFIFLFFIFNIMIYSVVSQDLPHIKIDKTWAYEGEIFDLTVVIPDNKLKTIQDVKLSLGSGALRIQSEKSGSGYSFDVVTNIQKVWENRIFTMYPTSNDKVSISAYITYDDGSVYTTPYIYINVLKVPSITELGAVILNMTDSVYTARIPGSAMIEVISYDYLAESYTSMIDNIKTALAVEAFWSLNRSLIYNNQEYRIFSFPLSLVFQNEGEYKILPDKLLLEFRSSEREIIYKELPVYQNSLNVRKVALDEKYPVYGDYLSIETKDYPQKLKNDTKTEFYIKLATDGLFTFESLRPYISLPKFLEEEVLRQKIVWNDDHAERVLNFKYAGRAESYIGYNVSDLIIPFQKKDGTIDTYELGFAPIDGNVNYIAFISFIGVIAFLFIGGIFFFYLYLKKITKKKKIQLPKDEMNTAQLLLFSQEYELTKREQDILNVLIDGKSTKEIAQDLYISPETAKKHIKNIMKKTNTKSRLEIFVLVSHYIKKKS